MATAKAKTTKKSSAKKTSKPAASKSSTAKSAIASTSTINKHPVKDFFSRKYDSSENILTIFKSPRIIGAILGEIIGTMLLTMVLLTLGLYSPLYLIFGILVITLGVFALSGANLNPAITVGMMASRRMSAIRGTLYIISQILGAWFGLLIVNAFYLARSEASTATLPQLATPQDAMFWAITMVEFICAIIIGFFFARALIYKRSAFTFSAVVASGIFVAIMLAIVITSNFMQYESSFVLNPAVAIMYQALPSEAGNFGELLGKIGQALTTYAIFPMIGATIGFYISDLAGKLSGEKSAA